MKIANRLAGTIAGMFVLFASVTAWAAAGQPEPWQMGLQDAVTPVAEFIHSFHNFLLVIITLITLFVLGLMLYIMLRFNAKANPVPSKNTESPPTVAPNSWSPRSGPSVTVASAMPRESVVGVPVTTKPPPKT